MNPWMSLLISVEPGIVALVRDILALQKKYPGLTADQLFAVVSDLSVQARATNTDTLALIDAALAGK